MQIDDSKWTYNEFLAFLMLYAAESNMELTNEEVAFIQQRTGIADIERIKSVVDSVPDFEVLDIVEDYRKMYLDTPEKEEKVRQDLEDLLKTQSSHTRFHQLENAVVHILERII
ncbi:MAG: hypothetical protein KIS94_04580 [Chitinophagales bacterium]|nr:hypothetical protein [Chitinophagales bacterium]